MRLGGFGLIKDYDAIRDAGFDYAELDMPEIEALNERDFGRFRDSVEEKAFPVSIGARLLPIQEPTFFVDGFDETSLESYIRSSCKKSSALGIKTIIFGNGKARWLIDEDSLKRERVFINFLRMLCIIAEENAQEVLIEPLGPKYSNYINTLPEAARIIQEAAMPNLFTMADLRHLVWSKESFEDMTQYRNIIHHVHIDYPLSFPERKYPSLRDDYDYAPFLERLRDYNGTLTVEADIPTDWVAAGKDARALISAYGKALA